jgi:hypothetical protein
MILPWVITITDNDSDFVRIFANEKHPQYDDARDT